MSERRSVTREALRDTAIALHAIGGHADPYGWTFDKCPVTRCVQNRAILSTAADEAGGECEERERDLRQELLEASYFHVKHDGTPRHPTTCSECRRLAEGRESHSQLSPRSFASIRSEAADKP